MLCAGHALDLLPFVVRHEAGPRRALRRLVRPREDVEELRPPVGPRLPQSDELEAVTAHDPGGIVAEPRVEGRLVVLEELVDPKLMEHGSRLPTGQRFGLRVQWRGPSSRGGCA